MSRRSLAIAAGVAYLFSGGMVAAPLALAQQQILEEVVVTGSRIARDPGSYVGPMTILRGDIVTADPNFSLNDSLSRLPSIGAQGVNRNASNGGRGINFTEIHQLGVERTLVMMNGRRMVSTILGGNSLGVDLQTIPVNMLDRVEVLADGASSVYGSDAVAGVVNLIPRTNFEGFEIGFGTGTPQDDGGEHWDASVLFGVQGSRGFFIAGVTAVFDGDVDFQDRDFSKIPLLGQADAGGGLILNLVGSGIAPEGRVIEAGGPNIIFIPDANAGTSYTPYDTFCLSAASGGDASGSIDCILRQGHRFNYNDIPTGVSLINENRAMNFAGVGEYNFDNGVTGYVNTSVFYREGRLNFTPLPVQGAAGRFTDLVQVPFTNPNIPADALALIQSTTATLCAADPTLARCTRDRFQMSYRGLDFGPRVFDYDADTLSGTFGLKGRMDLFGNSWRWDAWATLGRSELYEVTRGQLNVANLQRAVDPDACALDSACPKDALGNPTLNIFGRGPKTAAEIAYVTFDDQERTEYDMRHFAFTLAGSLAALPAGDLGFAGGVEYREEEGGVDTSGVVQAGDSGGNFAEPTRGRYDVKEIYAELAIPLLRDQPGAEALDVDIAGRWSDYNTFGSEFTYKGSVSWQPVQQLRFRGTYGTGYRAPNIMELFGGVSDTFLSVSDPCRTPISNANVQANCTAAGVPADFVPPAAQLKISQGGNESLDAEKSESFTVGLVWEPDFAPLRIAVDWYDIEVDDAIGTPDPVTVITNCYNSPGGSLSAPECARIGRGPAGDVVRFDLLNENLAKIQTSGLDLSANYSLPIAAGELRFEWLLNYLDDYVETSSDGAVSDRRGQVAGLVSSWSAYPEYRSNLSATFARDNWTGTLTWRYLHEMDVFDVLDFDDINTKVDAVNYFDLLGRYDADSWSIMAGVMNVTDKSPPYVTDVSANTSGIYDFLGRFFFARASISFR
jgi:iron complex outermembrane recepter protein